MSHQSVLCFKCHLYSSFVFSLSLLSQQVDEMYREAPIKGGLFDYLEFTRILKHGATDKDEQ